MFSSADFNDDAKKDVLEDYHHFLEEVEDKLTNSPQISTIETIFERLKKIESDLDPSDRVVRNKLLQMLQVYCENIIDALYEQKMPLSHAAACGLYVQWMKNYAEWMRNNSFNQYDPANIVSMINTNASRLMQDAEDMDNAQAALDDNEEDTRHHQGTVNYYMAAQVLESTFDMMHDLLETKCIKKEAASDFIIEETMDFLKALPHATADGLFSGVYDEHSQRMDGQRINIPVHSHAAKATDLYMDALELLKKTAPRFGLFHFINEMQPGLSVSLVVKAEQIDTLNCDDGKMTDSAYYSHAQRALDCYGYSLHILKSVGAEQTAIAEVISKSHNDIADELIEYGEIATLMALYDVAHDILPKYNDDRNEFRNAYAARHVYAMIEKEYPEHAGIFVNHLHKKSGLKPEQILLLLDVNAQKIVGASIALYEKDKLCCKASVLFADNQIDTVVYDDASEIDSLTTEYTSYAADEENLDIREDFQEQIKTISHKIVSQGVQASYEKLSSRFLTVSYDKI